MKKNLLISAVLVVALILLVSLYFMQPKLFAAKSNAEYQAVFLTNGQVYFGKTSNENGPTVELKDIYYLQVSQSLQQNSTTSSTSSSSSTDNSSTQLVKLGSEIHGPTDEMRINRDQIIFIEDLKSDGKVAAAIHSYQQTGGATTTTTK